MAFRLLLVLSASCRAEGTWHTRASLMACAAVPGQSGPCFTVTPDQRWEMIGDHRGYSLLRRTPPSPGEPPLFFHASDLAASSPARPAASQDFAGVRLLLVMVLGCLALPARLVWRFWRRRSARRSIRRRRAQALALAVAEIKAQQTRLQVRRLQLVIPDAYGTLETVKWEKEKLHFCKSRIVRSLTARGLAEQWPGIAQEVDRRIERAAASPPAQATRGIAFSPDMDPIAYEKFCALLLRGSGWDAQVTPASGDQGTDILARRGRRSMVLQCKLYSRPVGNSAVQQIAAARAHHRADYAAVVSNADFTPRARQLAATNDVYLLHHRELPRFKPAA